jgi:hypothetical protein
VARRILALWLPQLPTDRLRRLEAALGAFPSHLEHYVIRALSWRQQMRRLQVRHGDVRRRT